MKPYLKKEQNEYGFGPWQQAWLTYKKSKTAMAGLIVFAALILVAVFADKIAPYGYDDQNLAVRFTPPGKDFIFGTDNFGRDIFSRIVLGSRYSMVIGAVAMSFSCIVGTILGAIAGFYNDIIDNAIMRFIDLLMAIPSIMLAISIIAVLGNGVQNVILAVGISSVPAYARQIRATVLSIKDQEFIEAATCIGSSRIRTLFRHVLPNCLAPIIVQMSLSVSQAILSASSLSFIGLGITPPLPEWGAMLSAGRPYIREYAWIVTFPGLAIMLVVFALNLMGDGLRDALDPRLKR
ncbi:ABC transporter permease [Breznakiella homolactica]|uniref:ABC transporter permease n=1 Tax=Breznakiella homolactica TaxID=2798577 RepID=A0A7T7XM87_9SPIR|nr:ABC transporter permease [Breznakiella homolactica]QQO08833.1 ABC transporter permease [Breznakiella homolactica]